MNADTTEGENKRSCHAIIALNFTTRRKKSEQRNSKGCVGRTVRCTAHSRTQYTRPDIRSDPSRLSRLPEMSESTTKASADLAGHVPDQGVVSLTEDLRDTKLANGKKVEEEDNTKNNKAEDEDEEDDEEEAGAAGAEGGALFWFGLVVIVSIPVS
jgi:hypothetical protein